MTKWPQDYLQINAYRKNGHFVKEYIYGFDFNRSHVSDRLTLFSSDKSGLLPEFEWRIVGNKIITSTEYIKRTSIASPMDPSVLICFSEGLDCVIGGRIPHGDINRKNIIYDGVRLRLIDIEPILEIPLPNDRFYLRSTPTYIHWMDAASRRVTTLTDLVGFCCFSLWKITSIPPRHHANNVVNNIIGYKNGGGMTFSNALKLINIKVHQSRDHP